MWLIHDFKVKK